MFLKLNIVLKIILLICIWGLLHLISIYLFNLSISYVNYFLKLVSILGLCLDLMLSGFFLYQIFKDIRFPAFVYKIRRFETEKLYRLLGVELFQFILTNSFMRYGNPRVYLKGKGREYIKIYHEETKQSEGSHYIAMLFTLPYFGFYLLDRHYLLFLLLCGFCIFFNAFPSMLQRKNRLILENRFNKIIFPK